jgi:hypothetical protein
MDDEKRKEIAISRRHHLFELPCADKQSIGMARQFLEVEARIERLGFVVQTIKDHG